MVFVFNFLINLHVLMSHLFSESSKTIVEALAKAICQLDWKVKINDEEVLAIEDAGIHMCLKKLAILDKTASDSLGEAICDNIDDDTVSIKFQSYFKLTF